MIKKLFILPFDHRNSFSRDILSVTGKLNSKQKREVSRMKQIVFEAFCQILKKYKDKNDFGILIDERFGISILNQAKKLGIMVCLATEKSGQKEFKFEYGRFFAYHIRKFNPNYVKVLVRYNPLNKEINQRQLIKLKKLSDYCFRTKRPLMFELLVPPTEKDLEIAGSETKYDNILRVKRTITAIKEIKKQVTVDIWKLEGFSGKGWQEIIKATNKKSKIIILGRGENEKLVKQWLKGAAKNERVIGFAIGRTIFLEALQNYVRGQISRKKAINIISQKFEMFIKFWTVHKSKK